jgi:hypothetical protein
MVVVSPMVSVPILVRVPISVFVLIAALTVVFPAFLIRPAVGSAIISIFSPSRRYGSQRQQGGDEQCEK